MITAISVIEVILTAIGIFVIKQRRAIFRYTCTLIQREKMIFEYFVCMFLCFGYTEMRCFVIFFDRNLRYEEIKKNITYLYSRKLRGSGNVNCESIELRNISNDHAIQDNDDRTYIDIIEHENDNQSQHTEPVSDNILVTPSACIN